MKKLIFLLLTLSFVTSCGKSNSTPNSDSRPADKKPTNENKIVELKVPMEISLNTIHILKAGTAGDDSCHMELKASDISFFEYTVLHDELESRTSIFWFPKFTKRISGNSGELWGEWHVYNFTKQNVLVEKVSVVFSKETPTEMIFKKVCF